MFGFSAARAVKVTTSNNRRQRRNFIGAHGNRVMRAAQVQSACDFPLLKVKGDFDEMPSEKTASE